MSVSECEATLRFTESDDHDLISREDKERRRTKTNSSLVELIRSLLGSQAVNQSELRQHWTEDCLPAWLHCGAAMLETKGQ